MTTNASSSQFSRFRVLVADDDDGCRDSIVSLLRVDGFDAHAVSGGRAAIDLLLAQREALARAAELQGRAGADAPAGSPESTIHFLICDYNMPDLTGLDVLRTLRREVGLVLPSILVTANFNDELVRTVRSLGGFAVLPKPVEPVDFRAMVAELVRKRLFGSNQAR